MATKLSTLTRPIVNTISPYEPGKPISEVQREFGVTDVIKLASNENPLGPSPKAMTALRMAITDIHRYPDGNGYYLKHKLAAKHEVPSEWIVLGNDEAVIGCYEFFKYRIAMQIMNGVVNWVEMPNCEYDAEAMIAAITPKTKLLFIANPNNPTGTLMSREQVDWLMATVPRNVIVIFDEAYYEYRNPATYPETIKYVRQGRNVIVFRTFSKAYGIAGLRVGYAITTPEIAQSLNTVREAFNVNILGQIGALAALDDVEFLLRTLEVNAKGKAFLYHELPFAGLEYVASEANFILVKTPIPGRQLFHELLKRGVVIRPVDGYGLREYIRVSIGLQHENERFIAAVKKVLL